MYNCNAEPRSVRYTDLGGIEAVLHDIRELVEYPLQHPEVLPLNHLSLLRQVPPTEHLMHIMPLISPHQPRKGLHTDA